MFIDDTNPLFNNNNVLAASSDGT